jgi:hypothetical protein
MDEAQRRLAERKWLAGRFYFYKNIQNPRPSEVYS